MENLLRLEFSLQMRSQTFEDGFSEEPFHSKCSSQRENGIVIKGIVSKSNSGILSKTNMTGIIFQE